eukprot:gene7241-8418_t
MANKNKTTNSGSTTTTATTTTTTPEVVAVKEDLLRYPIFCCATGGKSGIVAVGGGGGAQRTGIPNGLQLYKWVDGKIAQLAPHATLDCVPNVAIHPTEDLIAYGIGPTCHIVEYNRHTDVFASITSFKTVEIDEQPTTTSPAPEQKKDKKKTPSKSPSNGKDKDTTETEETAAPAPATPVVKKNAPPVEQLSVRFNKSGDKLVTAGSDNVVRVWSVPKYTMVKSLTVGHTDEITDIDIHPQASHIITTSKDKTARLWNLLSGKVEHTLRVKHNGIDLGFRGARFSRPDGLALYTAASMPRGKAFNGCTVLTRWNTVTGEQEAQMLVHTLHNTCMEMSPSGRYIAIGTADSYVSVIDTTTMRRVDRWEPHDFVITGLCFSPDNEHVLSVSANYEVKTHQIGTGPKAFEAVDWLYSNVIGMTSRDDAISIGQRLLDKGLIYNLCQQDYIDSSKSFKDDYIFYAFSQSRPRDFGGLMKDELFQLALDLMHTEKGVKLQKKKKSFMGPPVNCFAGSQLIDWLVKRLSISRNESNKIANKLMCLNVFCEMGVNPIHQVASCSSTALTTPPTPTPLTTATTSTSTPTILTNPLSTSLSISPPQGHKTIQDTSDIYYEFLTKPEAIIAHVSMKRLCELHLAHKSMSSVPTTIINTLNYLKILDLSYNNLVDSTSLESVATLGSLESLNLSHNSMSTLPTSLARLERLVKLNLSNNSFSVMPSFVFQIMSLEKLYASTNTMTVLPDTIGQLKSLVHLDMRNNKLTKLPKELAVLSRLKALDVSGYNRISELPPFLATLPELTDLSFPDSVKVPPRSVTSKGFSHIIGYLRDMVEGATTAAPSLKLVVLGHEKSGRTALVRALAKSDRTKTMNTPNKRFSGAVPAGCDTERNDFVETTEWKLDLPLPGPDAAAAANSSPKANRSSRTGSHRSVRLLATDFRFANGDVYAGAHSFFLSERAFYLVTYDINREPQAANLDFWVGSIRARAPTAPIYVVATHIDAMHHGTNDVMRALHAAEAFLRARGLEVTGVIGVSSTTARNIDLLRAEIATTITSQATWLAEPVPAAYAALEAALADEARRRMPPVLGWDEYAAVALMANVTSDKLVRITQTLRSWGALHWFDDEKSSLRDTVVLSPAWLAECFQSLVNAKNTHISSDAILPLKKLKHILRAPSAPEPLHMRLIKILERFQVLHTLKTPAPDAQSPLSEANRSISAPLPKLTIVAPPIDSMPPSAISSSATASFLVTTMAHQEAAIPSTSPTMLRHSMKLLKPPSTSSPSSATHHDAHSAAFIQASRIIIPCLLPASKPGHVASLWDTWSGQDEHQIGRYYEFVNVPKSCFDRLMVRFLYAMEPIVYWSTGILFRTPQGLRDTSVRRSMSACGTLVEFDSRTQQLQVRVRGHDAVSVAKLFQHVLENVDTLLSDQGHIPRRTLVPCACSVTCRTSPHLYTIDSVESTFDKGEAYIRCPLSDRLMCLDQIAPDITLSNVPQTIKISPDELTSLEEIGVGGSARVFKGIYARGKTIVAVKQLNLDRMDISEAAATSAASAPSSISSLLSASNIPSAFQRQLSSSSLSSNSSSDETTASQHQNKLLAINEFRREVWLMSDLSHPNIVLMKGFCFDPYSIVMEYMDLGSLSSFLRKRKEASQTMDWSTILKIAKDIASGMAFLHNISPPLVHRDLKSPNILLATHPTEPFIVAKVSDFGLSRTVVQSFVSKVVDNPTWQAPEVLKGSEYNEKGDIYSYGMILWELYHMELPFDEFGIKFMSTLEDSILSGLRPTIHPQCQNTYASLMTKCWNADPQARPSFQTILKTLDEVQKHLISLKQTF